MTPGKIAHSQARQKSMDFEGSMTQAEAIAARLLEEKRERKRNPPAEPSPPRKFSWEK